MPTLDYLREKISRERGGVTGKKRLRGLGHPIHNNAKDLDGREPHPVALAWEDLSDRVFELLV